MDTIRTNGGALISPSVFQKSETAFLATFPNSFKMTMFNGCETIKDCDNELKALYAIHSKNKKKPR